MRKFFVSLLVFMALMLCTTSVRADEYFRSLNLGAQSQFANAPIAFEPCHESRFSLPQFSSQQFVTVPRVVPRLVADIEFVQVPVTFSCFPSFGGFNFDGFSGFGSAFDLGGRSRFSFNESLFSNTRPASIDFGGRSGINFSRSSFSFNDCERDRGRDGGRRRERSRESISIRERSRSRGR